MKVLVAGDFCDKLRVSEYVKNKDFSSLFGDVRSVISKADISIVNFEFPVVLNDAEPIKKCGPNLKGQPEAVDAIKYAGFNVCTLANNHILDHGEHSCLNTKQLIEEAGLHTVGVGENAHEASTILYLKSNNNTLAVINCCEHEFSVATANTAGANPLNPIQQYYQIQEACKNADFVLVIVHGGHEQFQLPSHRMKETYQFFVDSGADAVVNHHQHCYSGYEVYNGKPIFYGLGNFCFDSKRRDNIWNDGYMIVLDFTDTISFELYPYVQCNHTPNVTLIENEAKTLFFERINNLNEVITDQSKLDQVLDDYYKKCSKQSLSTFELYSGKLFKKLYHLGILPSFVTHKKALNILNKICCESHREKILYALSNKNK